MKRIIIALSLCLGLALSFVGLLPSFAVVPATYVGNVAYTILNTDQKLITTTVFTAARTWTLPFAGGTCIGQTCTPPASSLEIYDTANAISNNFTLTIAPQSGDTINGSSSSLVVQGAGVRISLTPTSGSNWSAYVIPTSAQTEVGAAELNGFNNPRNVLDNGGMQIQQRGTGTVTCAQNAGITSAAYGADRWACQANVASGAGQSAASVTTPPAGYSGTHKLWRNSGALTQQVCIMQAVPTTRSSALAGQPVTLSFTAKALAGLAADNGNVITANIFTGTGSDQGAQTAPTASPAITPAWTGIATVQAQAVTLTTSFVRYTMPTITLASTVTEIEVALCFTPTASGAGATDGFEFTGVQLEKGSIPTPFEFRPFAQEQAEAYRYFYKLTETAAIFPVATCAAVDVTHTNCLVPFLTQMRAAPAATFANGFASPTTTSQATLGACTTLSAATTVASTVGSITGFLVNCAATTIPAAGVASFLYSNGGTGTMSFSADL
jgi:hypothetical protein